MPNINIVLSDRNWILERLGQELEARIPGVSLSDTSDASADINYYITFASRQVPASTLEAGLFTHMEQLPELQNLFVDTARDLDLCVCMSSRYQDFLIQKGIENTVLIPPGVDLKRFVPKLRIGVVGRTYHTGRKGEAIVAELIDMKGIDWHFTGSGWPAPGRFIEEDDLPDFYRSLDYLLVPSLYEGGPMCVPEALAVGTPVIASDVGWVRDFPHIPFETGNASDLRRVLTELLDKKHQLRASTLDYTWDNFADKHDRAFRELMSRVEKKSQFVSMPKGHSASPIGATSVRLLLHGSEQKTLGGPSVRVPRTADMLRELGIDATMSASSAGNVLSSVSEDLVHVFNVWDPQNALRALRELKSRGKRTVFSPIYLDLKEHPYWGQALPLLDVTDLSAVQSETCKWRQKLQQRARFAEPVSGYHAMVREMIDLSDHVIFLSEAERYALEEIGAVVHEKKATLVRNPVNVDFWRDGDGEMFRKTHLGTHPELSKYVICVGRIEPRKNQLLLARVLRGMDLGLVMIGHIGHRPYFDRVRQEAGPNFVHVERFPAESEMLRSALKGAHAFCLPSWSEGASLAALEAAAAGCNLVLSDRSSEKEYFGTAAQFCDPGDPISIKSSLEKVASTPDISEQRRKLLTLISEKNTWASYIKATVSAYKKVLLSDKKGGHQPMRSDAKLQGQLRSGDIHTGARLASKHGLHFETGWGVQTPEGIPFIGKAASFRISLAKEGNRGDVDYVILRLSTKMSDDLLSPINIAINAGHPRRLPPDHFLRSDLVVLPIQTSEISSSRSVTIHISKPSTPFVGDDETRPYAYTLSAISVINQEISNIFNVLPAPEQWVLLEDGLHANFQVPAHRENLAPMTTFYPGWGLSAADGDLHIMLPVLPSHSAATLALDLRPITTGEEVETTVFINGTELTTAVFTDHRIVTLQVDIPAMTLSGFAPSTLKIHSTCKCTPSALGLGSVNDICGVGLMNLSLREKF